MVKIKLVKTTKRGDRFYQVWIINSQEYKTNSTYEDLVVWDADGQSVELDSIPGMVIGLAIDGYGPVMDGEEKGWTDDEFKDALIKDGYIAPGQI